MTRTTSATRNTGRKTTPPADVVDVEDVSKTGLGALLGKLKLPEVNLAGFTDSRRKDVEALVAANEMAYRGFEAVTRRQVEMLSEALRALKESATETRATQGAKERTTLVISEAQNAVTQALANMKELAEMSAKSQQQVMDTLSKRLREGISEITTGVKR